MEIAKSQLGRSKNNATELGRLSSYVSTLTVTVNTILAEFKELKEQIRVKEEVSIESRTSTSTGPVCIGNEKKKAKVRQELNEKSFFCHFQIQSVSMDKWLPFDTDEGIGIFFTDDKDLEKRKGGLLKFLTEAHVPNSMWAATTLRLVFTDHYLRFHMYEKTQ
jgi:hypothetical protein